ncbi:MAG: hypothetical protein VX589_14460 [Myxococcota bacterium]|nr:hypothetical protein [Myxococcota bacterium]
MGAPEVGIGDAPVARILTARPFLGRAHDRVGINVSASLISHRRAPIQSRQPKGGNHRQAWSVGINLTGTTVLDNDVKRGAMPIGPGLTDLITQRTLNG